MSMLIVAFQLKDFDEKAPKPNSFPRFLSLATSILSIFSDVVLMDREIQEAGVVVCVMCVLVCEDPMLFLYFIF